MCSVTLCTHIVMCEQSAYDILGVKKSATVDAIKQAYRKKAKQLHPDKNKDNPNAQEEFIKLSNAYETLSDPQKKAEYDDSLNPMNNRFNPNNHRGGGGGHPDFSRFHQHHQQGQSQNVFVYRGPNGQYYYAAGNPFEEPRFSQSYSYTVNFNDYSAFNVLMRIIQFCVSNFPVILIALLVLRATWEGNKNRAREQQQQVPPVRTNIPAPPDPFAASSIAPLEDLTLAHFVSYNKSTILILVDNTAGWVDLPMLKHWKLAFASDKLLFRVTSTAAMQTLIHEMEQRQGAQTESGQCRGLKVLRYLWGQLASHKVIAVRSNCSNLIDVVSTLEDWCIKTARFSPITDSDGTPASLQREVERWCTSMIGGEVRWRRCAEAELGGKGVA